MPLIDSDKWKAAFVSARTLRFHPSNPRIPGLKPGASEHEIIAELCKRGKVATIARSIAEKGYLRQERLIVVREHSKNIVFEGNRRLCALRLLATPEMAPQPLRATMKRLAAKAKLPAKVAIEILPTRFDAEIVMYAKHAADSFTVNWKPIQQAMFVAARLEEGETIDDLVNLHGLAREQIVQFRAAIDLYRMCRLAAASPEAKELVDDPDRFPYSTLFERLVRPPESRRLLGMEITDDGLKAPPTHEILPVLSRILEDAAHEDEDQRLTTRSLNTSEEQIAYVKSLRFTPNTSAKMTAAEMEKERNVSPPVQPQNPENPTAKVRRPKPAQVSNKVLPRSVVCEIENAKLITFVEEAQRLTIANGPNVAAVVLRCILDLALHAAVDERRSKSAIGRLFGKHPGEVGIVKLLDAAKDPTVFDLELEPDEVRLIQHLVKDGPLSADTLHLAVHNPHWPTTTDAVIQLRERLLPFIRQALKRKR